MYINHRILALKEESLSGLTTTTPYLDPIMVREHSKRYPASNKYLGKILSPYQVQTILSTFDTHPSTTIHNGETYTADQYIRYILEFAAAAGIANKELAPFIIKVIQLTQKDNAKFFKFIFSDNAEKKTLISNSLKTYNLTGDKAADFILTMIEACTAKGIPASDLISESQFGSKNASLWQFLIDCQKKGASYTETLQLLKTIITTAKKGSTTSLMAKIITLLETTQTTIPSLIANIQKIYATLEQSLMSVNTRYVTDKSLQTLLDSCISQLFNIDSQETNSPQATKINSFLNTLFYDIPEANRGKTITALYSLIQTKTVDNPAEALYILQKVQANKAFTLDFTGKTETQQLAAIQEQLTTLESQLPKALVTILKEHYLSSTSMAGLLTNYYLAIAATDLNTLGIPAQYVSDLLDIVQGNCGRSALLGRTVQQYLQARYPDTSTELLWKIISEKHWQADITAIRELFASTALRDLADKIQAIVMRYIQTGKILEAVTLAHILSITPRIRNIDIAKPEIQAALITIAKDLDIPLTVEIAEVPEVIIQSIMQFIATEIQIIIQGSSFIPVLQQSLQAKAIQTSAQLLEIILVKEITILEQTTHQEQSATLLKELRVFINELENKTQAQNIALLPQVQSIKTLILLIATLKLSSVLKNILRILKDNQQTTMSTKTLQTLHTAIVTAVTTEHLPSNILKTIDHNLTQTILPMLSTIPEAVPQNITARIQRFEQFASNTMQALIIAQAPAGLPTVFALLSVLQNSITTWDELVIAVTQLKTKVTAQQLVKDTVTAIATAQKEFREIIEKQEIQATQKVVQAYASLYANPNPAKQKLYKNQTNEALTRLLSLFGTSPKATTILDLIDKFLAGQAIDITTLSPQIIAVLLIVLPPQLREELLKLIQKKTNSITEWLEQYIEAAGGVSPLMEAAIHALTESAAA